MGFWLNVVIFSFVTQTDRQNERVKNIYFCDFLTVCPGYKQLTYKYTQKYHSHHHKSNIQSNHFGVLYFVETFFNAMPLKCNGVVCWRAPTPPAASIYWCLTFLKWTSSKWNSIAKHCCSIEQWLDEWSSRKKTVPCHRTHHCGLYTTHPFAGNSSFWLLLSAISVAVSHSFFTSLGAVRSSWYKVAYRLLHFPIYLNSTLSSTHFSHFTRSCWGTHHWLVDYCCMNGRLCELNKNICFDFP